MSFDQLQNKIQATRDASAAVTASFSASVDAVRSNVNLSPEGKQRKIAALYVDAQAKVGALSDSEKNAIATERTAVDRALFGTPASSDPSAMIAFRDAQDRAERIEDDTTALSVLNRTDITGDTELASAVLNQAVAMGWGNVIDTYAATHPGQAALVEELVALANLSSARNHLFSAWSYLVPKPFEIGNYTDFHIQEIASQPAA